MNPQERWWAFRARLPVLTRWQIALIAVFMLAFIVFALPHLLPLGGLDEILLDDLKDPNGAFIDINGKQIYYIHHPADGDAVIFVHGFGSSSVDWRDLLPRFSGYDTYAIDLLGFGLSEKGLDADLRHQAQADMLAEFMNKLDISRAHIVGHDMGGNIAVHLAQRHPEKVLSLALAAPVLIYDPSTAIPDWLLHVGFAQRWARIVLRWIIPASVEINLDSAIERDDVISQTLIEDYERAYHTPDWDLALLALARDTGSSALEQPLQEMKLPVLILWGEDDSWNAPDTAYQLEADFPNAQRVMFPGVGHLPMHEDPDAFRAALLDFWR